MWTDAYVGLPFECDGRTREGLDCWGLVQLAYHECLGIQLPGYEGIFQSQDRETLRRVAALMDQERAQWTDVPLADALPLDVLLIRITGASVSHVGLYAGDGLMLHISSGIDATLEPINPRWSRRIVGAYRHASRL